MTKGHTKQYIIIVALLILALASYHYVEQGRITSTATDFSASEIILDESRIRHILYGDERGGGHKYGVGMPCKTEFPADWTDQHILSTVRTIAANDNLTWREESNGYYVAEDVRGDIKVRVVLGPQKQRVITAYPTNLPRNPCPTANDN